MPPLLASCAAPLRRTVPREQGIVDQEAPAQQGVVVVAREGGEAQRDACSPAASGARSCRAVSAPRTISARRASDGSSSSPNSRSMVSKLQRSPSWLNLHTVDVERNRAASLARRPEPPVGLDEQETRLRIEEAADQPRTGDPIDFRTTARDPKARPMRRDTVERRLCDERQPGRSPAFIAAFQHLRVHAVGAQLRRRPSGSVVACLAGDHDGAGAVELCGPLARPGGVAPSRARDQVR